MMPSPLLSPTPTPFASSPSLQIPPEVPLLPSPSPNVMSLPLHSPSFTPTPPFFLSIDGGGTKTACVITDSQGNILGKGVDRGSNFTERGIYLSTRSISKAVGMAMERVKGTKEALSKVGGDWTLKIPREEGGEDVDDVNEAYDPTKSRCPFELISAGLAGIDSSRDAKIMHSSLSSLFRLETKEDKKRLSVSNDSFLLASGIEPNHRWGVVLIAGTGSISMAFERVKRGESEEEEEEDLVDGDLRSLGRMGGYGYLLGDQGSAYFVGREGIAAVLSTHDRQSGKYSKTTEFKNSNYHVETKSPLITMICQHFRVKEVDEILGAVYAQRTSEQMKLTEHDRKVKIAEVARLVVACAFPPPSFSPPAPRISNDGDGSSSEDSAPPSPPLGNLNGVTAGSKGDPLSLRVCKNSARELSEMVRELCEAHMIDPTEATLVLGTGMWSSEGFRKLVVEEMEGSWVGSKGWGRVTMVQDPAVAGCSELVRKWRASQEK